MAIKHLKIFKYNFTFVFRNRFEKKEDFYLSDDFMWREWELGFWYKHNKAIGEKDFHEISDWKDNMVNVHMFGINLLIFKAWFTIDKGAMNMEIEDYEKER
jgi:hypothetical protein